MIKKAYQKFLLKSGAVFFRFRNLLFPVFIIIALLFTRPALFMQRSSADTPVMVLGLVVAVASAAFRLFVIGFAYIKRGGKDGRVYADELVTEGIYAHVRNPMYVANFLAIVGIGMMYGSLWVYIAAIPFFAYVYLSIVVIEEDYLKKRFGDQFENYCRKANRFIPNFFGIKKTLEGFSYDWKKALRKEYGTTFGILLGCYIVWLRKMSYLYGWLINKSTIIWIILPFVVLVSLYCWVRYLKKSGRLKS